MWNKILRFHLILPALLMSLASVSWPDESTAVLKLSRTAGVSASPYYEKLNRARSNPKLLEKIKVLYLIDQVKRSGLQFERNGKLYSSAKAAEHLRMKYGYAKHIQTAEEFIYSLASQSSLTRRPYHILDTGGQRWPTRDVLLNELSTLEQDLAQNATQEN